MAAGEITEPIREYADCPAGLALAGEWFDLETCRPNIRGVWTPYPSQRDVWTCDSWVLTYLAYIGWTLYSPFGLSGVVYPEGLWGPRTDHLSRDVLRMADWIKNHGWPGGQEAWDRGRWRTARASGRTGS